MQSGSYGVFAVDGNTGQLITSRTGIPETPKSITFVTADNTVRMGTRILSQMGLWIWSIQAFDGTDLSPRGSLAQNAFKLAYDPMAANNLFLLRDPEPPEDLQNRVGALDISTGALHGTATGYRPVEMAINSLTNRVYVADEQTSEILAIDGTTHAVVSRIPILPTFTWGNILLDPLIRHFAISERLNRLYLTRKTYDYSTQVYRSFLDVIDGETNQLHGSIALDPTIGDYSDRIVVDDTRRQIYVIAARFNGTFSREVMMVVYDADSELPITTINLGVSPSDTVFGMAANPVTGRVYVSMESGVAIVDGNINGNVGLVNSARGEIAINEWTNKIYVVQTRYDDNTVEVINGATNNLETSFLVPPNNDFIAGLGVDPVTNRVYLAHGSQNGGRLTAYDANNNYELLGQTTLDLTPAGVAVAASSRQLFVSHDLDGAVKAFLIARPGQLVNISTRLRVQTGDNAMIGGFIIAGSQPKTVIVRGIGPSLPVLGALADPVIEVHGSSGELLASNDNWMSDPNRQHAIDAGLAPTNDLESALWGIINPGAYTVIVRGKNDTTGIGLFDVYDLDQTASSKLANISTRGFVETGNNVMIGGTIIVGDNSGRLLLRAIGPSLTNFGVQNPLQNPILELHDGNGDLMASNDDWRSDQEAEIIATGIPPSNDLESAIVGDLVPGNYTAIVRGVNDMTGVAVVEAYDLN